MPKPSPAPQDVSGIESDLPLVLNDPVRWEILRYMRLARGVFRAGLEGYARYGPMMRRILTERGLPGDLVFMAFVESGYNPDAVSPVGATGPWQFMPATATECGLRMERWIDERRDPVRSTEAAARYLEALHDRLGDWLLAMAAYNAGAGGVERAMRRCGAKTFWDLLECDSFKDEAKAYVPRILAVCIMVSDPKRYGFGYPEDIEPVRFTTLEVDGPLSLERAARIAKVDSEAVAELNPQLVRGSIPRNVRGYRLRIPAADRAEARGTVWGKGLLSGASGAELICETIEHEVRTGETLASIAADYAADLSQIIEDNGVEDERLLPGERLFVKSYRPREPGHELALVPVRPGNTLASIARRYGVTVEDLRSWNGLSEGDGILVGTRLRIVMQRGNQ